MVLALSDDGLYLERRPPRGIWGGLWSLPELASADDIGQWLAATFAVDADDISKWPQLRHSFSHFDLDITPVAVRLTAVSRTVADDRDGDWFSYHEPLTVGLAAPVSQLIEQLQEKRVS